MGGKKSKNQLAGGTSIMHSRVRRKINSVYNINIIVLKPREKVKWIHTKEARINNEW